MNLWNDLMQNFRKDGTTAWHKGKIFSSVLVVLALVAFVLYNNSRLRTNAADRNDNARYTVGLTGKRHHNIKSSKPTIKYIYKVSGVEYAGNQDIDAQFEDKLVSEGGKYFVQFSAMNPANSKLLLDYPVPNTLTTPPSEGWTILPNEINRP